jgi:hypothetical protein
MARTMAAGSGTAPVEVEGALVGARHPVADNFSRGVRPIGDQQEIVVAERAAIGLCGQEKTREALR